MDSLLNAMDQLVITSENAAKEMHERNIQLTQKSVEIDSIQTRTNGLIEEVWEQVYG